MDQFSITARRKISLFTHRLCNFWQHGKIQEGTSFSLLSDKSLFETKKKGVWEDLLPPKIGGWSDKGFHWRGHSIIFLLSSCHGTFGDRSPYLAQADQYANTDHHYADVDPRWRRKDRIDEYYYLLGINECYGDGYTFKIFLFIVDNITKLWIAFRTSTTEISDQPHVY